MGAILDLASFVWTRLGRILAVAFVAAAFYYGRWVLAN
jgi:hypothetical protein